MSARGGGGGRKLCEGMCCCVRHAAGDRTDGLLNSGECVCWPQYVKNSIFLCGWKNTTCPLHCMVGPDWAIMLTTSLAIIAPSAIFLVFICENISRYMTIADGALVSIAVLCHWVTAFTDPGTVYCSDTSLVNTTVPPEEMIQVDVEGGVEIALTGNSANEKSRTTSNISTQSSDYASSLEMDPPARMECNICEISRPCSARHCYDCGVCIDQMDHHCPFTGKCIGKNNYYPFVLFVNLTGIHAYFVMGTTAYYIIARIIVPAT